MDVLNDLRVAIKNIEESYYSIDRTALIDNEIVKLSESSVTYERNFVTQLKVEFELHLKSEKKVYDLARQIEVLKPFIYKNETTEKEIFKTYSELKEIDDDQTGFSLTTIPDFVIHLNEHNFNEENQKLILEAKTSENLGTFNFDVDLFKLNIYVDKFNFQNAIFFIVNNDIDLVKRRLERYKRNNYYLTKTNLNKIHFFIKENFDSELKEKSLNELLNEI